MLRFLVADDNEIVRRGLKQILLENFTDISVGEAIDVPSLIEKAINQHWDFIITDIVMPGGNGIEAMKKIKAQKGAIPVLVISTYPEDQYTPHAISAGANAYLSKDTIPERMIATILEIFPGNKII